MDKIDTKLLLELMRNSRIPVTQLAKRLKVSREVANYRMSKLKQEGVLLNFVTEINVQKLGFIGAAVFVNVKTEKEKEFMDFLDKCGFVSWVAELSGVWSFGFSIYGRTNEELDSNFLVIYNKFKESILDHRFTLHRKSSFFYEKYFDSMPEPKKEGSSKYSIDAKDKVILRELSRNSRIDTVSLSKLVGLTAPAIAQRIRHLEKNDYIQKYSIFVDISKLGLFQYSVFIVNKNIDVQKQLVSYLSQHPKISFIAEYVSDPFMEFGLIVSNPYELRKALQEIGQSFPDNRIIEVSLFQREFVSVGAAKGVFG
ncbi:hypothetical protein COV19_05345 [Candidatus Woesearchaeota archaeon CG10_big_fil_rev_8_21_14_0_10_44_13]|nr:MAG: hypothetical protein COV19_05345 [Candidatus Woesearchaeota archaeon CG10_big_fil_rev_8_21_14_0_10_44_13]